MENLEDMLQEWGRAGVCNSSINRKTTAVTAMRVYLCGSRKFRAHNAIPKEFRNKCWVVCGSHRLNESEHICLQSL